MCVLKANTLYRYNEMTNTDCSDKVIARIRSASNVGIKLKVVAAESGITYFRIASTVNTKSYRCCTTFTNDEAARINEVLDTIKAAI